MERETARLLKNTAIWMILVLITGGSIGLTERFFGKPASHCRRINSLWIHVLGFSKKKISRRYHQANL